MGGIHGGGGYGAVIRPQNNVKHKGTQASNKARAKTHNTTHSRIDVNASNAVLEYVGNADDPEQTRDVETSTLQYESCNLANTKGYARLREIPRENGR